MQIERQTVETWIVGTRSECLYLRTSWQLHKEKSFRTKISHTDCQSKRDQLSKDMSFAHEWQQRIVAYFSEYFPQSIVEVSVHFLMGEYKISCNQTFFRRRNSKEWHNFHFIKKKNVEAQRLELHKSMVVK